MPTNKARHLLILPRLRVQNANAISAPLTWGFPAMTAFTGLMLALERTLPEGLGLHLRQVGVICHQHDIQTASAGYNLQQFNLMRHPVDKDGNTAAIAEEGRMHMEISLIFAVDGKICREADPAKRQQIAKEVDQIVHGMRIAGGSLLPRQNQRYQPSLKAMEMDGEAYEAQFRRLRRQLLPGFALVLNEQAFTQHLAERRQTEPNVARLDTWLDFSRLHHDCLIDKEGGSHHWEIRRRSGWLVPIPVGYKTLSSHESGEVANARDPNLPFRFVESIYSVGQWISPHRLDRPESLLWYIDNDPDNGIYRLNNDYTQ